VRAEGCGGHVPVLRLSVETARTGGADTLAAGDTCFEAEKAFYEVEYEINSRPAWVGIPLRGLLDILGGVA